MTEISMTDPWVMEVGAASSVSSPASSSDIFESSCGARLGRDATLYQRGWGWVRGCGLSRL